MFPCAGLTPNIYNIATSMCFLSKCVYTYILMYVICSVRSFNETFLIKNGNKIQFRLEIMNTNNIFNLMIIIKNLECKSASP